jgi:Flp pilus assembly protein TadG
MRLLQVFGKRPRCTRGQTLVETSAALMLAIPVILWSFEMTMYFYTMAQYQYAARAGVQYAVSHGTDAPDCSGPGGRVNTSCPDPAGLLVSQLVAGASAGSLHPMTTGQVLALWPAGNNNPNSPVTVNIIVPYSPMVHLPFIPSSIEGTATGVVTY